jgi:hypothetical protein
MDANSPKRSGPTGQSVVLLVCFDWSTTATQVPRYLPIELVRVYLPFELKKIETNCEKLKFCPPLTYK